MIINVQKPEREARPSYFVLTFVYRAYVTY